MKDAKCHIQSYLLWQPVSSVSGYKNHFDLRSLTMMKILFLSSLFQIISGDDFNETNLNSVHYSVVQQGIDLTIKPCKSKYFDEIYKLTVRRPTCQSWHIQVFFSSHGSAWAAMWIGWKNIPFVQTVRFEDTKTNFYISKRSPHLHRLCQIWHNGRVAPWPLGRLRVKYCNFFLFIKIIPWSYKLQLLINSYKIRNLKNNTLASLDWESRACTLDIKNDILNVLSLSSGSGTSIFIFH